MSTLPQSTLRRMPIYLHFLKTLRSGDNRNVSATRIASALNLGEVQVRKDLAQVADGGRPKVGYELTALISAIEAAIGCKDPTVAIIVGVGNLGKALLEFAGFEEFGLKVIAGFDIKQDVLSSDRGKPVLPIENIESFIKNNSVKLGILTLPNAAAQKMADKLVSGGIKAVWNFTQTHIVVPDTVALRNENLAASLALLNVQMKTQSECV